MKNEIIMYEIKQKVRVRRYQVDNYNLCDLLRKSKAEKKLNNKIIAKVLNIPKTKVEHWFRRDESFAIPDSDIWLQLKVLLGIKTDKYDESIMTFIEKDGVYDKSNRLYDCHGIAPTLTCASKDEKVVVYG